MKRCILLGLAALGAFALTPTGSKADDGFRVYIGPSNPQPQYAPDDYDYQRYREYRWHRWHRLHHRYYDPDTGRYYYYPD